MLWRHPRKWTNRKRNYWVNNTDYLSKEEREKNNRRENTFKIFETDQNLSIFEKNIQELFLDTFEKSKDSETLTGLVKSIEFHFY